MKKKKVTKNVARGMKRKFSLLGASGKKSSASIKSGGTSRKRYKASMTAKSVGAKSYILLKKSLMKIGATMFDNVDPKVTHLCMDQFRATEKVLGGLAYYNHIVSSNLLTSCVEQCSKIFHGLKLYMTRKVYSIAHDGKLSKTTGGRFNTDIIVLGLTKSAAA